MENIVLWVIYIIPISGVPNSQLLDVVKGMQSVQFVKETTSIRIVYMGPYSGKLCTAGFHLILSAQAVVGSVGMAAV